VLLLKLAYAGFFYAGYSFVTGSIINDKFETPVDQDRNS